MSFHDLELPNYLVKALEVQGIKSPYPIQQKAIPSVLEAKDLLGIAKTGSGKTLSYVLPIFSLLDGRTVTKNRHINALVLVPTRELAIQVEGEFKRYGSSLPFAFKSMVAHGGVSINPQMKAMSKVNVLVATPGRLLELAELNAVHFDSLSLLVLDEADKMLNLGFKAEMDRIFALLPKKRQNLLFSATLSPDVQSIERLVLKNPVLVQIEEESDGIEKIKQTAYLVDEDKKGVLLRSLIRQKEMSQVLVFTSSVHRADLVSKKLNGNGIEAAAVHSKKSQGHRTESLRRFKDGFVKVLVTTDLLSRGIDITELPYVINYELPRSPKDFIHRIGRTGRAEKNGEAITFVCPDEEQHFRVIEKKMKRFVDRIDASNLEMI